MVANDGQVDLISRAIAGDQAATERVLLYYYDRLARRIVRKLPKTLRGAVSEEDILQQTFIEVFRDIGGLEPRGERSFFRWLVTIAEHRLQDAVRAHLAAKRGGRHTKANLDQAGGTDSADELIDLLAGPERSPSQSAARHEAAAAVHVGLASLTEDNRRALELRYIKTLPVAEIARKMNKTEPAVHGLCRRALAELRVVLGRSSQYFSRR